MKTEAIVHTYHVIPVLGDTRRLTTVALSPTPKYDQLKKLLAQHFDEPFEHVAVLYEGQRRDMFVGETSSINGRHIRNVRATEIYRRNALTQISHLDPEGLPAISGPAVLFPDQRVWF